MKTTSFCFAVLFCALVGVLSARAEVLDRPQGVRIGERLTLRPYVSLTATYDSNVNARGSRAGSDEDDDFYWSISPGLGLTYNAENWSLLMSGYYTYRHYFKEANKDLNRHTFGEEIRYNWANSTGNEKGWSLILGESFQRIARTDDLTMNDGRGYTSDSQQFQITGAVMRRFNEYWHGDINGGYYQLDYDNDTNERYSYYGWSRWLVGAEAGFAPSKWTDILLSGSYQGYTQDNTSLSTIGDNSTGLTLQGGLGSYMTDRISYRALAGWSQFDYGDGASKANGFVYTLSGNWKIGETWNMMLLGSSYYQPSERQYSSQTRVDSLSWGVAKSMVRGKLRGTFDIRYRHETIEHVTNSSYDYALDIWTGRIGLDYSLCRFLSVFGYGEYQKSMNDESDRRNGAYDYDRWRISLGLKLSY